MDLRGWPSRAAAAAVFAACILLLAAGSVQGFRPRQHALRGVGLSAADSLDATAFLQTTSLAIIPSDHTITITDELGGGSYSKVFKGIWNNGSNEIPVAVKAVDKHGSLSSVQVEAAVWSKIKRPGRNIVQYYGYFWGSPLSEEIMEYSTFANVKWQAEEPQKIAMLDVKLQGPGSDPELSDGDLAKVVSAQLPADEPLSLYLVTELVEGTGGDLFDFLVSGDFKPAGLDRNDGIYNIIMGMLKGIKAMAENNPPIAHRDIKPENTFLDRDYTAKIGDFGLALVVDESLDYLHAQIDQGTVNYMAPETICSQSRGVPPCTRAAFEAMGGTIVAKDVDGNFGPAADPSKLDEPVWADLSPATPYSRDIWSVGMMLLEFIKFPFNMFGRNPSIATMAHVLRAGCTTNKRTDDGGASYYFGLTPDGTPDILYTPPMGQSFDENLVKLAKGMLACDTRRRLSPQEAISLLEESDLSLRSQCTEACVAQCFPADVRCKDDCRREDSPVWPTSLSDGLSVECARAFKFVVRCPDPDCRELLPADSAKLAKHLDSDHGECLQPSLEICTSGAFEDCLSAADPSLRPHEGAWVLQELCVDRCLEAKAVKEGLSEATCYNVNDYLGEAPAWTSEAATEALAAAFDGDLGRAILDSCLGASYQACNRKSIAPAFHKGFGPALARLQAAMDAVSSNRDVQAIAATAVMSIRGLMSSQTDYLDSIFEFAEGARAFCAKGDAVMAVLRDDSLQKALIAVTKPWDAVVNEADAALAGLAGHMPAATLQNIRSKLRDLLSDFVSANSPLTALAPCLSLDQTYRGGLLVPKNKSLLMGLLGRGK